MPHHITSKPTQNPICLHSDACVTAEKADRILPLRHNPLPSDKQDTICCHWAEHWLDGGVKGAGCPWAASRSVWNHRTSRDRTASAQGHSCWWQIERGLETAKVTATHKSTPTFNFNRGVGRWSYLEDVDAHIHSGVVSSWSVQPAEQNHTWSSATAGLLNTHAKVPFPTCTQCSCLRCAFQRSPRRSSSSSSPDGRCGRWSGCTAVWGCRRPRWAWRVQKPKWTAL